MTRGPKNWPRLELDSSLAKGDQLMSLPSFRPTMTLSTSIEIQCEGPSLVKLVGWKDGVPVIAVQYGQLLVRNLGKANNPLQLNLGDAVAQVTFIDPESTLALEVRRVLPPGKNPEEGLAPLAVDLYATSGTLRVREGGAPTELKAPARVQLATGRPERPTVGEFPKWVTSETISEYERGATAAIEPLLLADRPADLVLREQATTHRRREVRTLANRCLAYLGEFDGSVEALNDKDEKTTWATYFDELRAAIARNPETAAQVRASFEKLRGQEASKLYRMLWGYSADDLRKGADVELVDALNNLDSLDVRVLAISNLTAITGPATHGYNPLEQAQQRAGKIKKWKEKLRKGEITPRSTGGSPKAKAPPRAAEKAS